MKGSVNKKRWREILTSNLPGEEAQRLMAPEFRGAFSHDSEPIRAAVLILIYPTGGRTNIVLIKRNEYDGPHSAQVSFPGGAFEEQDKSLEVTALRETREELGIHDDIEILGSLTEIYIPVSNFLVSPYAGWMDHPPVFNPDPTEVQYVIEASVDSLIDPANRGSETVSRHGQNIIAPFYLIENEKIWGATAMMLSEFLEMASRMQ